MRLLLPASDELIVLAQQLHSDPLRLMLLAAARLWARRRGHIWSRWVSVAMRAGRMAAELEEINRGGFDDETSDLGGAPGRARRLRR